MSELDTGDGGDHAPARRQSGIQIWIACALFIIVPALLILAIKASPRSLKGDETCWLIRNGSI